MFTSSLLPVDLARLEANYAEGLAHLAENSYAEAAAKFEEVLEEDPKHIGAHEHYAEVSLRLAAEMTDAAELEIREKCCLEAIQHLNLCIQQKPDNMQYYNMRAFAYFYLNELAKSALDFMLCFQIKKKIDLRNVPNSEKLINLVQENAHLCDLIQVILNKDKSLSPTKRAQQWNNMTKMINIELEKMDSNDILISFSMPPTLLTLCSHFSLHHFTLEKRKERLPIEILDALNNMVTIKGESNFFMNLIALTTENSAFKPSQIQSPEPKARI